MLKSVGVPKETAAGETRVAATPETVGRYQKLGLEVLVEKDAGKSSRITDAEYEEAGATVVTRAEAFAADLVVKVAPPSAEEAVLFKQGGHLTSFLAPLDDPRGVPGLAAGGAVAVSMGLVPRISRAEKMDAVSATS